MAHVPVSVLPLAVAVSTQLLVVPAAQGEGAQVLVTPVKVPLLHEKEQAPVYPAAHVPVSVLPLGVSVSTQSAFVAAAQSAAQVLVTCVKVPRTHEYEQAPVYPVAHVPVSVLPLFVAVSTQLSVVPATHGFAAQVLVTCVKVPRAHE